MHSADNVDFVTLTWRNDCQNHAQAKTSNFDAVPYSPILNHWSVCKPFNTKLQTSLPGVGVTQSECGSLSRRGWSELGPHKRWTGQRHNVNSHFDQSLSHIEARATW